MQVTFNFGINVALIWIFLNCFRLIFCVENDVLPTD